MAVLKGSCAYLVGSGGGCRVATGCGQKEGVYSCRSRGAAQNRRIHNESLHIIFNASLKVFFLDEDL